MDAYTAIRSKRDSRDYEDRPIPEEVVRRILQAGRMAGSSKNSQPYRFIALRDPEARRQVAACGNYAQHVPSAPLAVAVVLGPGGYDFDAGRCAQNMMVAAWAEGVTSCPVTLHDEECARRILGLPQGHRVSTLLAFGYPRAGTSLAGGSRRLPLEELVHHERW